MVVGSLVVVFIGVSVVTGSLPEVVVTSLAVVVVVGRRELVSVTGGSVVGPALAVEDVTEVGTGVDDGNVVCDKVEDAVVVVGMVTTICPSIVMMMKNGPMIRTPNGYPSPMITNVTEL